MSVVLLLRAHALAQLSAAVTLALAAVACAPSDGPQPVEIRGKSATADDGFVAHLEPAPGVRFPMPKTGMKLDVASFDPALPAEKFRHEIRFVTDAGDLHVMLDVWDNPRHLDVRAWFDENLTGLVNDATAIHERTATKRGVAAIGIDQPASDEAFSQSMAVFATADHVYLVTSIDPVQVPAARALFEKVVDGLELEVFPVHAATNAARGGSK